MEGARSSAVPADELTNAKHALPLQEVSVSIQLQFAIKLEKRFTGLTFLYLIVVCVQKHSKSKDLHAELCKLFKEHTHVLADRHTCIPQSIKIQPINSGIQQIPHSDYTFLIKKIE